MQENWSNFSSALVIVLLYRSQVLQEVTVSAQAAEKVKSQVQKVKDKAQAIVDDIAVSEGAARVLGFVGGEGGKGATQSPPLAPAIFYLTTIWEPGTG